MAFRRVQVNIHRENGLPEDDAINVWHFDSDDPTNDTDNELLDKVEAFYTTIFAAGYMSPILTGELTMKIYDMEDPKPRVPLITREVDLGPSAASDAYPSEIAICLSMKGEMVAGVNMARRRGRVYIGPLAEATGVLEPGDVRPQDSVCQAIIAACKDAFDPSGLNQYLLSVYSPTTDATSSLADSFHDVKTLWVDNAFDVQRRRGAKATERFTDTINA